MPHRQGSFQIVTSLLVITLMGQQATCAQGMTCRLQGVTLWTSTPLRKRDTPGKRGLTVSSVRKTLQDQSATLRVQDQVLHTAADRGRSILLIGDCNLLGPDDVNLQPTYLLHTNNPSH